MMSLYIEFKSFLLYRKLLKAYSLIDLSDNDKIKLQAVDKEVLDKVNKKAYEWLAREMLENKLSPDYILWWKQWIAIYNSFFRKYHL